MAAELERPVRFPFVPRLCESIVYNMMVESIVVSGSDVYVGGGSDDSTGILVAGYWRNGAWVGFANPYGAYYAKVNSLAVVAP
jgi:hypothetical protein